MFRKHRGQSMNYLLCNPIGPIWLQTEHLGKGRGEKWLVELWQTWSNFFRNISSNFRLVSGIRKVDKNHTKIYSLTQIEQNPSLLYAPDPDEGGMRHAPSLWLEKPVPAHERDFPWSSLRRPLMNRRSDAQERQYYSLCRRALGNLVFTAWGG
jgi:hypothetical protein